MELETAGRRRQVCVHEAAHAAAGARMGWTIHSVSIGDDGETLGRAHLEPRAGADELTTAFERLVVAHIGDLSVLAWAADDPELLGMTAATKRFRDDELRLIAGSPLGDAAVGYVPDSSDADKCYSVAASVCLSVAEIEYLNAFARERARNLLADADFVAEVEKIAEHLFVEGSL